MKSNVKILAPVSILLLFLASCNGGTKQVTQTDQESNKTPELTLKWESDPVFKTPESVCFDSVRNVLYISNIDGKPTEKDGNGYINKISTSGELIDSVWVTGLNAPKGMGILGDYLYVTDIDRVVKIGISDGVIIDEFPVDGAQFLNDIAVSSSGEIFVSDSKTAKVYRMKDDLIQLWIEGDELTGVNGLFCGENNLYIGTQNQILAAGYSSKDVQTVIDSTGSIDGLKRLTNGGFLFSNWKGSVFYASSDTRPITLYNTEESNINAADIEFIEDQSLLFIPTFFDNRIIAYTLDWKKTSE